MMTRAELAQHLKETRARWGMGTKALKFLQNRIGDASETHGLDTKEVIEIVARATTLATRVNMNLRRAPRLLTSPKKKKKKADLYRVGGAFKTFYQILLRPLKLYGAWGAVKGLTMYLKLASQAVITSGLRLEDTRRLVGSTRWDTEKNVDKLLRSALKDVAEIKNLLKKAAKKMQSIKIE